METLNEICLETTRGFRKIILVHGDITHPSSDINVLVVSAFEGDYEPVQGTVIGSLHTRLGLSVEALSRHPQIDLREPLGCWISEPITNQSFRRIICVLGNPSSGTNFAERVHACAKAIVVLEAWDPSVRTVAMPLLGTGNQGFIAKQIAPALVSTAEDLLESALRVDTVFFVEVERAKAVALSAAVDAAFGRKRIVLGTGSLNNTIRALLLAEIEQSITECSDDRGHKILKKIKAQLNQKLMMTQLQSNCRELCEYLVQCHGKQTLNDTINKFGQPDWVRSYLHVLRCAGNLNAHLGVTGRVEMDSEDFSLLLIIISRLLLFFRNNKLFARTD